VRDPEGSRTLAGLLGTQRVLPLAEVDDIDAAVHLARVLLDGGLPVIEIALRTDAAIPAVEAVRAAVPGVVVGVGTVLTAADLTQAISAGGAFAVSPGSTAELLAAGAACAVPFVPGIATASELMRVSGAGFREAKCFPAATMGGPAAIAALSASTRRRSVRARSGWRKSSPGSGGRPSWGRKTALEKGQPSRRSRSLAMVRTSCSSMGYPSARSMAG